MKDFTIEKVGTGQLGETRRFHLKYESPNKNCPATLIGKFPSDDLTAANTGRDMGFYKAEVMFYKELAERSQISTPKPLYAQLDGQNNFVLILEDLYPAKQGDHMTGCSIETVRIGLKEAALLHSAFWNNRELEKQQWLYIPSGAQGFYTTELVKDSWSHFKSCYSAKLDPLVIQACEKFVSRHEIWNMPRTKNRCFSHNDFRVDNMLFLGNKISVVDWQTSNYLGAGMDAAYFIGSALSRENRIAVEHDLLQEYHQILLKNGVRNYELDELLLDYRHYSLAAAVVAIAATVIVEQTERGDALFLKMVEDSIYQAIDNDALDLL
ncbi:MAG: phosphotransferase [Pseudomonadota bacterium]|nr:phosphotransferase [Pseudomonadota bacterium]